MAVMRKVHDKAWHKKQRKIWIVITIVAWVIGIICGIWFRSLGIYVLTPSDWIMGLVVIAFHSGWIRRDEERGK
jgi:hypothetical protein